MEVLFRCTVVLLPVRTLRDSLLRQVAGAKIVYPYV